jgi:glycosyltransferase involved in cell wall biosynthesis
MTVIHQENGGVSMARNKGLSAAKGRYICFIDVDDRVSSNYLQVLYDALQTTGLRVAAGNLTREEEDLLQQETAENQTYSSVEFLREFLYRGVRFHICACMFARECFEETGLCFPVGFRYSEDVYLMWQIFAAQDQIVEVKKKIYYYYNNPASAMNKGIDLRRMDAIRLMEKLEEILEPLAPEFSPEFNQYAVARHHWSILWQAATMLESYKAFKEYAGHFEMKSELKKLLRYPEKRISLSSALYIFSPRIYYHMLRAYVKIKK